MKKTRRWYDSPEVDALLDEAAKDDSPRINMSEPGALEALRERLGLTCDESEK